MKLCGGIAEADYIDLQHYMDAERMRHLVSL
jgi:hypothetical protein